MNQKGWCSSAVELALSPAQKYYCPYNVGLFGPQLTVDAMWFIFSLLHLFYFLNLIFFFVMCVSLLWLSVCIQCRYATHQCYRFQEFLKCSEIKHGMPFFLQGFARYKCMSACTGVFVRGCACIHACVSTSVRACLCVYECGCVCVVEFIWREGAVMIFPHFPWSVTVLEYFWLWSTQ